MEKRFAILEIGVLVLSVLAISVFIIQDFKQTNLTGNSIFNTYQYPDNFLPTGGLPSCTENGGRCIGKSIFGGYSCFGAKSSFYSCPKSGQICCILNKGTPDPAYEPSITSTSNSPSIERTNNNEIPTFPTTTEKTYSNICAHQDKFEWKYLLNSKLTGTDASGNLIYNNDNAYQLGCIRSETSCSNSQIDANSGTCSFRTVTVYTNGFKESENSAPNYFGVLGESYLEEKQNMNIFSGYEVQYDDSGSLIYELTNDRTKLTIGINSTVNQTNNTITIITPSSGEIKKECRCKTKTSSGTDCSPLAGTNGCVAQKMQSGPYYGCIGLCSGADCDSGNSCSFYNKKGEALGELIKQ